MTTWLRAAALRMVKTGAQTLIAIIGTAAVIADVNWTMALSGTGVAMLLSVLTSLAGLPEADGGHGPRRVASAE